MGRIVRCAGRCIFSGILLLGSAFATAEAAIVNVTGFVEGERPEGLDASLTASVDLHDGNSELFVVGLAPSAQYKAGDHLVLMTARGEYGRSNGERVLFKTFEHLRYRHRLSDRWSAEVFGQHEFDEFRRLSLRALGGLGPRAEWAPQEQLKLAAGLAYMLEYEKLRDNSGENDAGDRNTQHRASSYLTGQWQIREGVTWAQTFYLQPRLDRGRDLRLLNETRIGVRLTERIQLTTALTVGYDTRPPDSIRKTDTSLRSAITIDF